MQTFRKNALAVLLTVGLAAPLAAAEPLDINSADAAALAAAIDGVGLKRAQAIIEYRTANGPFRSVDDLAEVSGIGKRTVDNSKDRLTAE